MLMCPYSNVQQKAGGADELEKKRIVYKEQAQKVSVSVLNLNLLFDSASHYDPTLLSSSVLPCSSPSCH